MVNFLFNLLSYTWGLPMSIIGGITKLVVRLMQYNIKKFGPCYYSPITEKSGISLGPFLIVDRDEELTLMCHELGHAIQNIKLGFLMPFIVAIPSAFRFWVRKQETISKKYSSAITIGLLVLWLLLFLFDIGYILGILPLMIVSTILISYVIALECWMLFKEIPKYKNNSVPYDNIWFEKNATKLGTNYYNKYITNK